MMGFVATILIGAAIGALGAYSVPGQRAAYFLLLLATFGSFAALLTTYLGHDFGWNGPNDGAGLIGSLVGAFLVFAVARCAAIRSEQRVSQTEAREWARPDKAPRGISSSAQDHLATKPN
jgi:uncharacterized membrane protein YeaQ/YmgE (transglycosylase-associated protein family)